VPRLGLPNIDHPWPVMAGEAGEPPKKNGAKNGKANQMVKKC